MLRVNQGSIKYHFLSLWYDSTWDWTQVSRAIGKHPVRVIPETQKMVFDTSFLNTQQYKLRIEGKGEQSRERSTALHYTLV